MLLKDYIPYGHLISLIKLNGNSSSCNIESTIVWLHSLKFNETSADKARRLLDNITV